jgi:phenol 2-monooxygenase
MVLVRPDQYVSAVLPLDAHAELSDFLATILLDVR